MDTTQKIAAATPQMAEAYQVGIAEDLRQRFDVSVNMLRERFSGRGRHVAALALSGSVLVAACSRGGGTPNYLDGTPVAAATASPDLNGGLVEATDESLAAGGFNCGNTADLEAIRSNHLNYANEIGYFNANPELAKNVLTFQRDNAEWGMGSRAWDYLMQKGLNNSETPGNTKIAVAGMSPENNETLNSYAHKMSIVELTKPHMYRNFTCTNAQGEFIPPAFVGNIIINPGNEGKRNHVVGIAMATADMAGFEAVVNQGAGIEIIHTGVREINGTKVDVSVVVLTAAGCDNPIRKFVPGEVPSTVTVTSQPPTSPPMSFRTVPSTTSSTFLFKDPSSDQKNNPTSPNRGTSPGGVPGAPGTTSTTMTPETQPNTTTTVAGGSTTTTSPPTTQPPAPAG